MVHPVIHSLTWLFYQACNMRKLIHAFMCVAADKISKNAGNGGNFRNLCRLEVAHGASSSCGFDLGSPKV